MCSNAQNEHKYIDISDHIPFAPTPQSLHTLTHIGSTEFMTQWINRALLLVCTILSASESYCTEAENPCSLPSRGLLLCPYSAHFSTV